MFCTNCGKRVSDRASPPAQTVMEPVAPPIVELAAPTRDVAADARTCPSCSAPALPGLKFCRECGTPVTPAITPSDGAPVQHVTPLQSPPVQVTQPAIARLVTLLKDGSEGRSIPLSDGEVDVGASEGSVTFPDDPYMSPRHARVSYRSGSHALRDLDSVNGVYVRLREEMELHDRDMLLVGQQVLRFEVLGDGELALGPAWQRGILVFGTPEANRYARLVQYTTEGVARDVHYLFRDETVIGRENGDIVFTDDPFLSRRHAAVRVDHDRRRYTLHDVGSSNGTALRIRGEHVLRDGDQFRVGRHLFRYEAGSTGGRAGR